MSRIFKLLASVDDEQKPQSMGSRFSTFSQHTANGADNDRTVRAYVFLRKQPEPEEKVIDCYLPYPKAVSGEIP